MQDIQQIPISITPSKQSCWETIDWKNLGFGKFFTDHQFIAEYKQGEWVRKEIVPFGNIPMSPALSALHYGQSIFEGLKAYQTPSGEVRIFRMIDHWKRLNQSAERLCMPAIPQEIFVEGIKELVKLDKRFIPRGEGESLYLRPIYFASDAYVGLRPATEYLFIVFASPVGAYYGEPVRVRFERSYIRATHGGVGYVKTGGNYARSMLATEIAKKEGFHNVIWLDSHHYEYVEECGTMNLFFVINDTLITPPTSGTILEGITRDTVIQLAQRMGWKLEIRKLSKTEILESHHKGNLQECFGTGTAVSVSPIVSIGYDAELIINLPDYHQWNYAPKLQKALENARTGSDIPFPSWITTIN